MFPLSGFLLADSKSNSSTRLPLSTTTRVSSGWDASMIILLDIVDSRGAPTPWARDSHGDGGTWGRRANGLWRGERFRRGAADDRGRPRTPCTPTPRKRVAFDAERRRERDGGGGPEIGRAS